MATRLHYAWVRDGSAEVHSALKRPMVRLDLIIDPP